MTGLKIISRYKYKFSEIFLPLFEEINGLYWLFEKDSLFLPESLESKSEYDYEKEKYISGPGVFYEQSIQSLTSDSSWLISKNNIFPIYAEGVNEDWNLILGFNPDCCNLVEWSKKHSEVMNPKQHVANTSEIVFANTDAAFWEVFANNSAWLKTVESYCGSLRNTKIEKSKIENCYAI